MKPEDRAKSRPQLRRSATNDATVKMSITPHFGETSRRPLNLHFTRWNLVVPPRDSVCRLHVHDNYELIAPVASVYKCSLNGCKLALKPGSVLFIQPGDSHEDYYRKGSSFIGFHFQLRDFNAGLWRHGVIGKGLPPECHIMDMRSRTWPSKISNMLTSLISTSNERSRLAEFTVSSLCDAFFWSLVSSIHEERLSIQFRNCLCEDEFRLKVSELFEKAVKLKVSAGKLASMFGMGERALDYKFASAIGMSPAKAFTCYKLDKAVALLESGSTVKETAQALGFADQFHFSKVFKRHMGLTPSDVASDKRLLRK